MPSEGRLNSFVSFITMFPGPIFVSFCLTIQSALR
ncbi:Protein of unknown function [Bacillus wiedmannii]|uniref:Uncharacterized protein n=1 Tax=Bacillus wiedmannii TaxID=1890302 RepID=A0AB37YVS4_9BACI|nr:Protein of unknown function [Bacillus wiedmannii]